MTPKYKDVPHIDQGTQAFRFPVTPGQTIWETEFESIAGVSRISENDFVRLRQLLASCEDVDSYLTSPTYYSFTGRHGLWVYEKKDAFVLVCWHPNVSDQILIFPQLVKSDTDLAADLLNVIPEPTDGIRIARVKASAADELKDLPLGLRYISLERRDEDVLDWKYPIRVLSTAHVSSLSGHGFMKTRNHIRQLKKRAVETVPFDAINHSRALENLLHRWATYNATSSLEYDLLYAPYETLFSHSLDKSLGLSGQMMFVDGQLQAVGLWDVSNNQQKTANVYVNFCNTEISGLSEFSMVKCCETLHGQGIDYVNLGGSETEQLDAYKRKFAPAISIDLCSVDVRITNVRKIPKFSGTSDSHQSASSGTSNVERTGF
jgi:hypothetical protein